MFYLRCILTVLALGTMLPGYGQHRAQFHFRHLTKEDGFTQGKNTFVFQDSYGLVWISSRNGLSSFDGQKVKNHATSGEQDITSPCFEDGHGNLWFSTFGAIQCYRRKQDDIVASSLKDARGNLLNKDYYAFHLDRDGYLWVRVGAGSKGYLYLYNIRNAAVKPMFPLEGGNCSLIYDQAGNPAQIVSANLSNASGFLITDAKTGKQKKKEFYRDSNGKKTAEDMYTNSAYPEGDSVIWVAVYGGLGVYYPKKDTAWVIKTHTKAVQIEGNSIGEIWSIVPYDDRYLLVSGEEAGLMLFDKRTRKFVRQFQANPNVSYGLKTNSLKELYRDRSDNLWVIETGRGLAFANLFNQQFERIPEISEKYVTALYEDPEKNIWCSTLDSGLYVFNQARELLFHTTKFDNQANPTEPTLPGLSAFIEDADGVLWAVYLNNLLRWDALKKHFHFEIKYYLKLFDSINYYLKSKSGKHLAAIGAGIYELNFSGNYFTRNLILDLTPFEVEQITAIYQDDLGYFYFACDYQQLMVFQEDQGQLKKIREFDNVGECSAFYAASATNKLRIATSKGLFWVDRSKMKDQSLQFQQEKPLPEEAFYAILPDQKGRLWLSGSNGLIQYNPQQQQWHRFSVADGLQGAAFNQGAWLLASNGEIWLGGPNGLNVFHPDAIQQHAAFPAIVIDNIKINDVEYRTPQNVYWMEHLPKLHYSQNTLSFDFLALEYNDPESIQFRYRLTGQDTAWVESVNPGFVRFSKLPAGHYTLELLATNADGVWMDPADAKKIAFYVPPPWWRTVWFYALCLIAISGIVYGIFRYRLEQVLKLERMRVKISSDLHDDVGTILSGLAMQSEILEMTAPENSKPKLKRISELSRSAMSHMRDTVWAIDARKDKLENLLDRMREHAEETLTPKDIAFDLQIDQLALTKNMPAHIRQNLYLIYKEALTNIAKHSNAAKVQVKLHKFGANGLEMSIQDNGEVKQKDYKTTGLGLSNMRMRAEQIGATFHVDPSNGFLIVVQLPRFS